MEQTLLEKHETLVVEIAEMYLDNMESELGKKYKNNDHQINAGLTDEQYFGLRDKYNIDNNEFADLYSDFQKMKPTTHLQSVMAAFTKSGGSVDVEPAYDENTQRLSVAVNFVIEDKAQDSIEGLSPIEGLLLKMDAMHQVENVLSGSDPDMIPTF